MVEVKKYLASDSKESSTRLKSFIWCIVFIIMDLGLQASICISVWKNWELLKHIPFLVFILVDILIHLVSIYYPQYLQKIIEMGAKKFKDQ